MLVILLPLTGCIDVSDNADAQDASNSEETETTVINNYYNNTTVVQNVGLEVITHYIPPNGNLTLSFDGTYTYKIESIIRNQSASNVVPGIASGNQWRSDLALGGINMTCNGTNMVIWLYSVSGSFLPVLPNQICTIEIDRTGSLGDFVSFTRHPLA